MNFAQIFSSERDYQKKQNDQKFGKHDVLFLPWGLFTEKHS